MIFEQIIAAGMILTTPILLTAMGGLVNKQAGIVNIGLEGKMLSGAFAAVIISSFTGSWLLAVLGAAFTGAIIGLIFSFTITRTGANMIVAGLGLNVLLAGILGFILNWSFNSSGTLRMPNVVLLPKVLPEEIQIIPIFGKVLAELDPLTIFAWLTVIILPFLLTNTKIGLWIRVTGNAEKVSHSVGIRFKNIQDFSTVVAGFFSGLGGAHLALFSIGLFNEGLTAGRGFIALAAFYFGRDRPVATALACLLFGFLDATQIRMQTIGLPPKLIGMIPYLMVLLALIISSIRKHQRTAK